MNNSNKDSANKDILYGALWCIGGIIGTLAEIGFIFWGAIVFGGIQFLQGLNNSNKQERIKSTIKEEEFLYYCKYCGFERETNFDFCPECKRNNDGILAESN
jgi:hypothetical protein